MIRRLLGSALVLTALFNLPLYAQKFQTDKELQNWVKNLKYETNTVTFSDKDGKTYAKIHVPKGYKFLNGPDSKIVLEDVWGNPPSSESPLGLLFPAHEGPLVFGGNSYAITVSYVDDGHVDDEDSKEINYNELLTQLKESTQEESEQRKKEGYGGIELIGWASNPYYDSNSKKLHWAKEYHFEGSPKNTLNYNIRILGRTGYLLLNVLGDTGVLGKVKGDVGEILRSVEFVEGHRYADYDSKTDNLAAYGIGGLIAGGLLKKAGLFALIATFFAKGLKLIVPISIGIFYGIRKLFFGKGKPEETNSTPPDSQQ